MRFVKMEGLGNDFIVIEGPTEPSPSQIGSWCDRRRGIGADGVLEVTPIDARTVRMRYWNADGGEAEMCGNGLRCVARYASDRGWVDGDSFIVETAVGPRPVQLTGPGSIKVLLGTPMLGAPIEMAGKALHVVNMGNPHAVIWVDDPQAASVEEEGSAIGTASYFPNGTNVEFATITGVDQIDLRVWERGVGETLACGTGAAATAYLAYEQGLVGPNVSIRLGGGDLSVDLGDQGAWIEGPANTVFEGVLN